MIPPSEYEDLEKVGHSSALEVALGLALAGAVCGLVALSQSASASTSNDTRAGSPVTAVMDSADSPEPPATPKASNSMELALLLRQRASGDALLDEGR